MKYKTKCKENYHLDVDNVGDFTIIIVRHKNIVFVNLVRNTLASCANFNRRSIAKKK